MWLPLPHILAARPESGYAQKIHRAGGGARTKRVEVAR
jgi:hypothetical protein